MELTASAISAELRKTRPPANLAITRTMFSPNPQIAARLLSPLTKWRNYTGRDALMKAQLERLAAEPELSPDVFEVVTKSLQ